MSETPGGLPDITLKKYDRVALGALFGGLAIATIAAGYGLYLLLPFLIQLAQNTIIFFAELGVAVMMVLFGAQAWMSRDAIYYKMKVFARNARKAVVREDPIGTLDVAIHRFESKLEEIDTSSANADAAKQRLANRITQAKQAAQNELATAAMMQRQGKPDVMIQQHARQSDRWEQTAAQLQPMLDNLTKVQTAFIRARDLCAATLEDYKGQKATLSVQMDAMRENQKSVKAFKRFFSSNTDLDMLEMSVEEIERQSTEAEAEIDQFLRVINPQLETADTKKAIEADRAMSKLNDFIDKKKQLTEGGATVVPIKDGIVVPEKVAK